MTDTTPTGETPDAMAFVDEMTKVPTLDEFFTRNPNKMTDDELDWFIKVERDRRAEFITKESSS